MSKRENSSAAIVDREMRKLPSRFSKKPGAPNRDLAFLQNYYKTKLDMMGLSLPVQRARFAAGYDDLRAFTREQEAAFWFDVWSTSNLLESMSQAIFFFETWRKERMKKKEVAPCDPLWPYLEKMVDRCENWVHSDGLSNLISAAIEERPARFATLKKWNRDEHPWKRRQSIVSIYFYARMRKKRVPIAKALPMIEALLDDDHFYVQRGVGWALREAYNVDPKRTLMFLEKHVARIAPIGYFAATELLSTRQKKKLLERRRSLRKTSRRTK